MAMTGPPSSVIIKNRLPRPKGESTGKHHPSSPWYVHDINRGVPGTYRSPMHRMQSRMRPPPEGGPQGAGVGTQRGEGVSLLALPGRKGGPRHDLCKANQHLPYSLNR